MRPLYIMTLLVIVTLIGAGTAHTSGDSEKRMLLIVHSYAMDYEWTAEEDAGITAAVEEAVKGNASWVIKRIYLDGKKYQENPFAMAQIISKAKAAILRDKPDAAIMTDDLAFQEFYAFLRDLKIPVSFAGVNGFIEDYGYRKEDKNITGTLEHNNFPAMVKIIERIRPTIKRIVFVGDISQTTDAIIKAIRRQMQEGKFGISGIGQYEFYKTEQYEELQQYLSKLDPNHTAIVLISFYTYKNKRGENVYYRDVDKWLYENTSLIDAGIASFHVKNGRLLSLASSGSELGHYCGSSLMKMVSARQNQPGETIRETMPLQLVLNHDRAKKLSIEFPFEILSYSRDIGAYYRSVNRRGQVGREVSSE